MKDPNEQTQEEQIDALTHLADNLGIPDDALDEAVYDSVDNHASNVNNGGHRAQIEFLLQSGMSFKEVQGFIEAAEDDL